MKTKVNMTNICTMHERAVLQLIDSIDVNDEGLKTMESKCGTVKWIEPNDDAWRVSWGRVTKVRLNWWGDGTGRFCTINVIPDGTKQVWSGVLLRDQTDEDQQRVERIVEEWIDGDNY